MQTITRRKLLGRVCVDSGQLVVIDPAYALDDGNTDQGVTFDNFGGDGIFPVYAVFSGPDLLRVEIDFGNRSRAMRKAFERRRPRRRTTTPTRRV